VTFSFMGYVMMLTGAGTSAWWFGERLPWTMWPALGLIVLALGLMQRARQPAFAVRGIGARTQGSA
jgi:hypothetical protein